MCRDTALGLRTTDLFRRTKCDFPPPPLWLCKRGDKDIHQFRLHISHKHSLMTGTVPEARQWASR